MLVLWSVVAEVFAIGRVPLMEVPLRYVYRQYCSALQAEEEPISQFEN